MFSDRNKFNFFLVFYFSFFNLLIAQIKEDKLVGPVKYCDEIFDVSLGKTSPEKITQFDKKGRVTTDVMYKEASLKSIDSTIHHYNLLGDTSFCAEFYGKNDRADSFIDVYDKIGLLLEREFYFETVAEPFDKKKFVYENNLLVSDTEVNEDAYKKYTEYDYDAAGNRSRMKVTTIYKDYTDSYNFKYESDSAGNDTVQMQFGCGHIEDSLKLCETIKRTFNMHGNIVLLIRYDEKGKMVEKYIFQYVYDNKGNWIKQTESYANYSVKNYPTQRKNVSTRRIEYY